MPADARVGVSDEPGAADQGDADPRRTASSTSTTPDNLWAIDARSGRQLWRYTYPANKGFHIGHRGAPSTRTPSTSRRPTRTSSRSMRARTARCKWNVEIADSKRGYWSTNAPLIIRNHLLVGVSGDFDNLPGILKSFDPETGNAQWTFYSTPPPGTPGSQSGGATGGQMWMTGTYDPELNLVYRRHRQSDAGAERPARARRQPVDLQHRRAQSGHRQARLGLPGVAARHARLGCGRSAGARRRARSTARRARCCCRRRATATSSCSIARHGKNLLTTPFATVNWAKGIDEEGRPIPDPGEGAGARRPSGRARTKRRHELPIAELRSRDRAA